MEWIITADAILGSIIGFLVGVVVGWTIHNQILPKNHESVVKTFLTLLIIGSWFYLNIILQVGDWWMNFMMTVAIGSVFGYRNIQETIEAWRGNK